MNARCVRTFLVVVILAGAPAAQDVFRVHDGALPSDGLCVVARIQDLDVDGVMDYVIGAPFHQSGRGRMAVVSGATGIELWSATGSSSSDGFARALADARDFDGDSIGDVIVGAPSDAFGGLNVGSISVFSGATATLLHFSHGGTDNQAYGQSVAGVGDVDGDGYDDIAVGGEMNFARILGGPDGHLIRSHQGPPYGTWVSGLDDVDGDGHPDYLIGWEESSVNGTWTGTVRGYSGYTGAELYAVHGDNPAQGSFDGDHLGYAVGAVGDWDGDGISEFIAGAPGGSGESGASGPGYIRVYSGVDAGLLYDRSGDYGDSTLGIAVACGDDINGDGFVDVVAGASGETITKTSQGAAYCLSGNSKATLSKVLGANTLNDLGQWIAILGDLDGDGYSEWAVGDPQGDANGPFSGRITIYRGGPGDAARFCGARPNSSGKLASIDIEGPISISYGRMSLRASDAPPGQFGLFFYGGSEIETSFGNGKLCAGGPVFRLGPPLMLDSSGSAERAIDFSAPPVGSGPGQWTPGSTWILQFWFRDPTAGGAAFNLSDAIRLMPTP